jgi:putative ABC transport system permease protein
MKSVSKGSVSSAFRTIRTNRGRSFTTMLGIIISVVAALLVVGLGIGVKNQVQGQLDRLGKDLITIKPGPPEGSSTLSGFSTAAPASSLTARDVKAVKSAKGVESVTPLATIDGTVSAAKGVKFKGQIIGTTSDFARTIHQDIDFGTFFSSDDSDAQMAVVGSDVAADVFDENVPLGRAFTLRGQNFIVVGILKPFETTPLLGEANFNDAIFIPYDTAQQLSGNTASVYEILIRAKSPDRIDTAVSSIRSKLLAVHGGQQTFAVLKQGQSLSVSNGIVNLLSALILVAAGMALFVGGIGIMNIMLVSVTERMREIGIRKAVGATNRQIMSQFLTEAVLLSAGAWLIGTVLSIAAIYVIRLFTTLEPVVPWAMVGISLGVTMLTGVLFGSIPALKAAIKDPIDALRNE